MTIEGPDIVIELRQHGGGPMERAADEIERLRRVGFSATEVQISNIDTWNSAVSKCQRVINQVADDYQELKVPAVARQLRCVSMLLDDVRRDSVSQELR